MPVETPVLRPNRADRGPDGDKGVYFIALSQFGIAFSFNCIMSFMPFYLLEISGYGLKETILWTGFIMGGTSLVAGVAAPFWGGLTARIRPKLLFQTGMWFNCLIFLIMGFTSSLPAILALRLAQGVLGGLSTIGLVLIAGSAPKDKLARSIGLFQNSLTAGQLVGPPLGAYAVTLLGYRSPFIIAVAVMALSVVNCHRYVRDVPVQPPRPRQGRPLQGGLLWGWALIVIGTAQLMFLPSILPQILEGFRLTEQAALRMAGTIMMAYMATAILGNYALVRLANRLGPTRVIAGAGLAAALLQGLLYLTGGVAAFTLVRMLQTGMIAAVIPLVISAFAVEGSGTRLGFLNSGRFVGNALGPIMATYLLAHFDLLTLYAAIALLTLALLAAYLAWGRQPPG